jgi:hypothetical protein
MYNPFSDTLYIHGNRISGTSNVQTGPLGALLILAMSEIMAPPVVVPDLIWDGIPDPTKVDGMGQLMPQFKLCFGNNGDADFANLNLPQDQGALPNRDATPHACTHAPLPAVVLP